MSDLDLSETPAPLDEAPDACEGALSDTPTEAGLRAEGYDDDAIAAFRASGVLRESAGAPWTPQTLEDVDWVCYRAKELEAEMAAIDQQAERRKKAVKNSREFLLARHGRECLEIVKAALPRDKKGAFRRKFLDLDRVRVKITVQPGGWRIDKEAELLAHLETLDAGAPEHQPLIEALKATETVLYSGEHALEILVNDTPSPAISFKLYAAGVKTWLEGLKRPVNEETGEELPLAIPGVKFEPPSERFSYE